MPDIENAYIYSAAYKSRLEAKFPKGRTNPVLWADGDLEDIRSAIRDFYRREQNGKCAYCSQPVSLRSAANCQIEHIIAKTLEPDFIYESKNLCVICADCNEIKRNQEVRSEIPQVTVKKDIRLYPRSSNAFLIVHPHFDNFDDHLMEINGYYLDLSEKGSYTLLFCKLNRKLHKLGYDQDILDMPQLLDIMQKILNEKDALKQSAAMKLLKKKMMLI